MARFVKWLVVPALCAALGYFVIGPKLGSAKVPAKLDRPLQELRNRLSGSSSSRDISSAPADSAPGQPSVSVNVKPVVPATAGQNQ